MLSLKLSNLLLTILTVHPSSSYLDGFFPMNFLPQALLMLLLHCCLHDAEAYDHDHLQQRGDLTVVLLSEIEK
jgi:hypothetical protein